MIYYNADENHKILMFTKSAQSAEEYHLTKTCQDDGLEQAYNGAWYEKGYAPIKPEPTLQEQVNSLEQQYQMYRWQREMILAEGSSASEYAKTKAQEIEDLAAQLRD